ncbi:hypothetical protein [Streptomyces sp. NBC_00557]|uniref:hypothetical protein n=1 Tax=Streptomyces sp. NBC_00557 TaxID=2975776 RepID=UPI002E80CA56|nr:hypothetical protein [Streptomyces sp. NBC_00557]WUC32756.1 hypothetical protein OG956_00190 [Streptomyces sp. NBC_00557]
MVVNVHPRESAPSWLATAAADFAEKVEKEWRAEWEVRRIHDPCALPVRFRPGPQYLQDHWPNIRQAPAGSDHGSLALSGRIEEFAGVYEQIESRRIVVLGGAGSGKTSLTLTCVLDLLANWPATSNDRVPVIFQLASWNPQVPLDQWMVDQLTRAHPGLSTKGEDGVPLAESLVGEGLILPVLDGFDEIASGLHPAALKALNHTSFPLIMTSRTKEYRDAVVATEVLKAAALVVLDDLTLDDLQAYLPRTVRTVDTRGPGSITDGWGRLLDHMRVCRAQGRPDVVTSVLSVPLMASLAREIYSEAPGKDPWELAAFEKPEDLETHLLSAFLATAYGRHRGLRGTRRWTAERVRQWHVYLARHLSEQGTRDLEWWRLGDSIPARRRVMIGEWTAGMSTFVVGSAVGSPLGGWVTLVASMLSALAGRKAFGITPCPAPSHNELYLQGAKLRLTAWLAHGLRAGLRASPLGLFVGLFIATEGGWVTSLLAGMPVMTLSAVAVSLAASPQLLEAPVDPRTVATPSALIAIDRKRAVVRSLLVAVLNGSGSATLAGAVFGGPLGLRIGLGAATTAGVWTLLTIGAWPRWLVLARCWLPLVERRLPWRLPLFLQDAHKRGVLRRVGPIYQFRHAQLQEHLAGPRSRRGASEHRE